MTLNTRFLLLIIFFPLVAQAQWWTKDFKTNEYVSNDGAFNDTGVMTYTKKGDTLVIGRADKEMYTETHLPIDSIQIKNDIAVIVWSHRPVKKMLYKEKEGERAFIEKHISDEFECAILFPYTGCNDGYLAMYKYHGKYELEYEYQKNYLTAELKKDNPFRHQALTNKLNSVQFKYDRRIKQRGKRRIGGYIYIERNYLMEIERMIEEDEDLTRYEETYKDEIARVLILEHIIPKKLAYK